MELDLVPSLIAVRVRAGREGLVPVGGAAPLRLGGGRGGGGGLGLGGPVGLLGLLALPVVGHLVGGHGGRGRHSGGGTPDGGRGRRGLVGPVGGALGAPVVRFDLLGLAGGGGVEECLLPLLLLLLGVLGVAVEEQVGHHL